jgi:hypothetical protein
MSNRKRAPTRINDPVDVPAEAFQVKAYYFERPSTADIAAILRFLREEQAPHLWSGHTHTKPSATARVVFLEEFQLTPETAAPCPCCVSRHAKYWRTGMIAWFPEEGTIRLMGWKCFASMNANAYAAREEYREEKERQREVDFLLNNIDIPATALAAIQNNLPIAKDVDDFVKALHRLVYDKLDMRLPNYIRVGMLSVEEDGVSRHYAQIKGYGILSQPIRPLTKRLLSAQGLLNAAQAILREGDIANLSDAERHSVASAIGKGVREAESALADLESKRRFTSAETVNTLRTWGKHAGCPCEVYIKRDEQGIHIGKAESRTLPIRLGVRFNEAITLMPKVRATAIVHDILDEEDDTPTSPTTSPTVAGRPPGILARETAKDGIRS